MSTQAKRLAVLLCIITLVALVLRVALIGSHGATPEDISVVVAANNYMTNGETGPIVGYQPPLRNVLTYGALQLFGSTVWGVFGVSLLLGTLTVPLLGLFVWRLSGSVEASAIAAAFLAVDTLHVDFSRQAIQEVHTTFFFMLGCVLVLWAFAHQRESRRWALILPLAGVAFGLGVASKGHALPPLLVSGCILLWAAWRQRRWQDGVFVVVSLAVVGATTYVATYIPWFKGGSSFAEWVQYQRAIFEAMAEHSRPAEGYLAFNRARDWFIRPLLPYVDIARRPDGTSQIAVGVGNPLLWWAVLPAAAWSAFARLKTSSAYRIVHVYFWVAYLPLVFASRPIWLLSALGVIPFAYALLALVIVDAAKRFGWRPVVVYLVACGIVAAALMPLGLGYGADFRYLAPILEPAGDLSHAL